MIRKLKRFAAFDKHEKALFYEACLLHAAVRTALSLTTFKRLSSSLECVDEDNGVVESVDTDMYSTVIQIQKAVSRASAYTPWHSSCLIEALTAHKMLKKRNVPGMLYLGIAKQDRGEIEAHAWTISDNIIVTGGRGVEHFSVVSRYRW